MAPEDPAPSPYPTGSISVGPGLPLPALWELRVRKISVLLLLCALFCPSLKHAGYPVNRVNSFLILTYIKELKDGKKRKKEKTLEAPGRSPLIVSN